MLVTGINGFVGSWVGKLLLDQYHEKFHIRASVRSLANQAKLNPLKAAYGEDGFKQIEFVEADLM